MKECLVEIHSIHLFVIVHSVVACLSNQAMNKLRKLDSDNEPSLKNISRKSFNG